MSIWTDDINGEPDTSKGVSPVRRRVLGDPAVVIQKGAGCLAYLVTTNIKADGKRIPLHNLARNQLMKASMEIERQFSLIKAEEKLRLHYSLKPVDVQRVLYGKAETKRAITNVLDHVLPAYKYASLAELNAVLKLYNVIADKGTENSSIYQSGGLVYRTLNANGEKVGAPVKASLIYS